MPVIRLFQDWCRRAFAEKSLFGRVVDNVGKNLKNKGTALWVISLNCH
jgi:hypothetical protein